jgi:hypothetical protein
VIYEVEWLETARQELGKIWEQADPAGREVLRRIVPRVNDRLAIAPYTQGESRPGKDIRILFELPLTVRYRIERFHGAVVVVRVRLIGKRPRT